MFLSNFNSLFQKLTAGHRHLLHPRHRRLRPDERGLLHDAQPTGSFGQRGRRRRKSAIYRPSQRLY